jgi:ankyrin repeat protein
MYFARYGNLKLIQDYVFHNKDYYANDLDSYKSFLNKIDKAGTGKNAFMYAATYNKDYKVLKFLRFEGADVFNKDSDGKDALMLACQNNNEITVIYRLLDYGFDYTQKDKENNNAAYYLTKNSSLNTDKELMKMIAPNKIQEER